MATGHHIASSNGRPVLDWFLTAVNSCLKCSAWCQDDRVQFERAHALQNGVTVCFKADAQPFNNVKRLACKAFFFLPNDCEMFASLQPVGI